MVLDHQETERMHNSRGKKKIKTSGINIIRDERFLPDDLLMEIAIRLPIQGVLKFRLICKRIKDLIMSRHFMNLFKIKSCIAPVIFFFSNTTPGSKQYLLKNFWESECTRSEIPKSIELYPEYAMALSQNGLIVSKSYKISGEFIVFNPIYSQNVKITIPCVPASEILGIFYQDAMKEYCTLWQITVSSLPVNVRYKMLNLGCEPKWKEITNPWTQNGRIEEIQPVSVNEYLYWVVEPEPLFRYTKGNAFTMYEVDVMEFDTRMETFGVFHCPVTVSFWAGKCDVSLLQANDLLLLVQIDKRSINIWTLKDRANKTWTRSGSVKVPLGIGIMAKAVAYRNEEIVIQSILQELLVCKTSMRRSTKIGNCGYKRTASFMSHVMSLASLENCKSEICMVEEDKNRPKNVWFNRLRRMR